MRVKYDREERIAFGLQKGYNQQATLALWVLAGVRGRNNGLELLNFRNHAGEEWAYGGVQCSNQTQPG